MGSPFGFQQPFGTQNPLPFPLSLLDVQTLPANAAQFPRDFFFPGVPNILWAVSVPGYGGVDVISFRFNGDAGANYWDNADTTAAVAASGTTAPPVSKTATVSTNLIRLGIPINKWRVGWGQIINFANREKGLSGNVAIGSATPPANSNQSHMSVSGGWDGLAPSKQITQVTVLTAGGLNMLAGTQVWFFSMF